MCLVCQVPAVRFGITAACADTAQTCEMASAIRVFLTRRKPARLGVGGVGAARAYLGDPATGSFTLTYGSNVSDLTLQDFYVRYQGLTGLNGIGSATGREVVTPPVPEPSTWAMMLFGFGALGFAMRRRRQLAPAQRVRFAL